jgi:hypothetical protein
MSAKLRLHELVKWGPRNFVRPTTVRAKAALASDLDDMREAVLYVFQHKDVHDPSNHYKWCIEIWAWERALFQTLNLIRNRQGKPQTSAASFHKLRDALGIVESTVFYTLPHQRYWRIPEELRARLATEHHQYVAKQKEQRARHRPTVQTHFTFDDDMLLRLGDGS